ncbi:DUF418 domain-containing protein [Caulobacter sp. RHG1]|uniref:DUF418 domain-containing protein n=1 Tax=Caulobacter sp. (strain RHG1) TaxID=2545762 RepID=UPI001554ED23|nr:DUF418 domain-containing protein [Caulobacter sp. RHG1]NQE61419.1 hypothetical protein [Caulobacter sp. RHG1]
MRSRIEALDVLRGVAVLGILLMNIQQMGRPYFLGRPDPPVALNADWIVFMVQDVLLSGAMRGLFTLLFGAGMALMLQDADKAGRGERVQAFATRAFALMALGVASFAVLLWPGEILFDYGVCGLVLLLFRAANPRLLGSAALVILLVVSLIEGAPGLTRAGALRAGETALAIQTQGRPVTLDQAAAIFAREDIVSNQIVTAPERQAERQARTHFPQAVTWSLQRWIASNISWQGVLHKLRSLAFMLIGMALLANGVLTAERSLRFYAGLAAGGYALGATARGALAGIGWHHGFVPDPTSAAWQGFVSEGARLSITLGLTGLVLLAFKLGLPRVLGVTLGAVGRLALTNYMAQSAIALLVFMGLGLFDRLGFAELAALAGVIWLGQGLASVLWLRVFETGPLEWILRRWAYGPRCAQVRTLKP